MSQSLLTPSVITKETLVQLENNLVFAGKVNRQFENQFVKIGDTITVRKPNRFTVSDGAALVIQNINEPSTSITISNQKHVGFLFSAKELTLTVEEFSERYLKGAALALGNKVDFDLAALYSQVNNEVGTPATVPNNFTFLAAVGQRMDEGAVPQDGRCLVINAATNWSMAAALSTLYVRSVAEPALKGFLAAIANFEIFLDQNVNTLTSGNYAGTGVVNGANQTGSSILTNGWTANRTLFNGGEVVTFAGVNAINPVNYQSTGALANFVITGPVTSDGAGNATLTISPAIVTSGAYQTVSASPANGAAVSVISGAANSVLAKNLGFVRDAFGLVTVPKELPEGVDFAARETYKNISIRIVRAYDINNDVTPCRLDILYGVAAFYPELACRLTV